MSEARRKAIYDSCRIVSPAGELMCLVAEKRARWYLDRGLARVVAADPLTIALEFEPRGTGHVGDPFYTTARPNHCAACGATSELTLHHVVPHGYRRYFPEALKSHSCHDLVPLCLDCHARYEARAIELRRALAVEHDAPLLGTEWRRDPAAARAKSAGAALARHAKGEAAIPAARRAALAATVAGYFGAAPEDCNDGMIALACALDTQVADPAGSTHGARVVARLGTAGLQEFAERWRRHFVETLAPRFMPEAWRIDRPLGA